MVPDKESLPRSGHWVQGHQRSCSRELFTSLYKAPCHSLLSSVTIMEFDPRLHHPFPCLVAGPTGCGKSQFVKRLLTSGEAMLDGAPEKILWCYGEYQPLYDELSALLSNIEFVEGIPSQLAHDDSKRTLTVVDDLMSEGAGDKRMTDLFCKKSHHRNCSIIFIIQNLFARGKEMRSITQNCHYMVLFKNPRDSSIVTHLAKQMYPGRTQILQEAFSDATSMPHGYLLIDLKQTTPDMVRLRTNIFSNRGVVVYAPRL